MIKRVRRASLTCRDHNDETFTSLVYCILKANNMISIIKIRVVTSSRAAGVEEEGGARVVLCVRVCVHVACPACVSA